MCTYFWGAGQQLLEDIVKEIKVYEDKIVLELYGSGSLNFEHKKTRSEGGSLLDGCSFRIQSGGPNRDRTCDLNAASVALSQLSYRPIMIGES